jgi:hypothetical protein
MDDGHDGQAVVVIYTDEAIDRIDGQRVDACCNCCCDSLRVVEIGYKVREEVDQQTFHFGGSAICS